MNGWIGWVRIGVGLDGRVDELGGMNERRDRIGDWIELDG